MLGIWGVLVSILDAFVRVVDSVVPAVFGQYHVVDGPIKKRRECFVLFIALATIPAAVSAAVSGLVWIAVYLRDVEVIGLLFTQLPDCFKNLHVDFLAFETLMHSSPRPSLIRKGH